MQVDTWERGFSYAYDAPLDMRMDPDSELTAARDRQQLGRAPARPAAARVRRGALRVADRARDRARPPPRELSSTQQLVDVIKSAVPVPAQFAGGHPARRTFQALRIAVNDELSQLDAALPIAWEVLRPGRPVRRDLVPLARGPPGQAVPRRARTRVRLPARAPICVCGHEPEAELLTRRAVAPTPGEIAANPRSKSAHLRAARKLEGGSA